MMINGIFGQNGTRLTPVSNFGDSIFAWRTKYSANAADASQ